MSMGRKVLISFLGTGAFSIKESRTYKTAHYKMGSVDLGDYSFVAAALEKHYHIDSTYLLGTVHSMWEEVYRWQMEDDGKKPDDDIYLNIAEACEKSNHLSKLAIPHQDAIEQALGGDSKVILIKYGITDEEIRDNINIILGIEHFLQNGDELIVDITHSFRSLPIFIMNLLVYLQNVSKKAITISHIHYGMLDIIRELQFAPIIDLKSILEINNWITGAYSFSEFGNAYMISQLMEKEDMSVSKLLRNFSNIMNLNHLFAMRTESQRLASIKNKTYATTLPSLIINPIVQSFVNIFNPQTNAKDSVFQLNVANWQIRHRKYAQAFLTLNEAIISYVCEINRLSCDNFNDREMAKDALNGKCPTLQCDQSLKDIYHDIKGLRNATAHVLKTRTGINSMINKLNRASSELNKIIV